MAGKRKKSRSSGPKGPKEYDEKDAKIGNISTYEDVADSEDEFHIQRDKVMLDDGPQAKRQRKYVEEGKFWKTSHWKQALTCRRCIPPRLRGRDLRL